MKKHKNLNFIGTVLWAAAAVLAAALLFARLVYPELLWLTVTLGVPLVGALGELVRRNRAALKSRQAAFGLNSAVTVVLVVAIVGVLNFMASRYPFKADLTRGRVNTLSDQTLKVIKGLEHPLKAVLYAKLQEQEQNRALLSNYKSLSSKFELEFVDPNREPTRAIKAGIKKSGTLQLVSGTRESKVEEVTEEKITNAVIKLLKEKSQTLCAITGHGEKNFGSQDAEGYAGVKKALGDQSYEVKDLNLVQDAKDGKVPTYCDAIAVLGPTKSFFDPEVKMIREYLASGGRALIALDVNVKGGDYAPELAPVLKDWFVRTDWAVIVDPISRMLGVDAAVPIVATYSKEHPITKDFQANSFFPFARPLEIIAGAPAEIKTTWIGQTTPKSWAVTNPKQLASGEVRFTPGKDRAGPLTVAIAVEGKAKDSKAPRATRIVAFGSSNFATNNYGRFAGNMDFFLNAASWVMEDENLISIRAREEGTGKIELSQKAGTTVFYVAVILVPLMIAMAGLVIWIRRRRL